MTRVHDEVGNALRGLNERLREIKSSDEDDLGKIAAAFDDLSAEADKIAERFHGADTVLVGKSDDADESAG